MRRAALEKARTLRTWREHLATHRDEPLCACELRPGRFRKSQRVAGCGRARCWLCHFDKLARVSTLQERRAAANYDDGMAEVPDANSKCSESSRPFG